MDVPDQNDISSSVAERLGAVGPEPMAPTTRSSASFAEAIAVFEAVEGADERHAPPRIPHNDRAVGVAVHQAQVDHPAQVQVGQVGIGEYGRGPEYRQIRIASPDARLAGKGRSIKLPWIGRRGCAGPLIFFTPPGLGAGRSTPNRRSPCRPTSAARCICPLVIWRSTLGRGRSRHRELIAGPRQQIESNASADRVRSEGTPASPEGEGNASSAGLRSNSAPNTAMPSANSHRRQRRRAPRPLALSRRQLGEFVLLLPPPSSAQRPGSRWATISNSRFGQGRPEQSATKQPTDAQMQSRWTRCCGNQGARGLCTWSCWKR